MPNEIIDLLKRILYEIVNQESLTRDEIRSGVSGLQGTLSEQSKAIADAVALQTAILEGAIETEAESNDSFMQTLIKTLRDGLSGVTGIIGTVADTIANAVTNVSNTIGNAIDAVKTFVKSLLDGLLEVLRDVRDAIANGFASLAEAMEEGFTGLIAATANVPTVLTTWIESSLSIDEADVMKYVCQFLSVVENCKECSYLTKNKL